MISSRKILWLVPVAAILIMLATGCNDTLRQFITPVPSPGGDPGQLAHAVVLSTNPATPTSSNPALGTDLHIDVSGDSVVGVVPVGTQPRFLGRTGNRIIVLNAGAPATQTTEAVPPSVSSYIGLLPLSSTVTTITLPTGTIPQAGAFSSNGNFYVVKSASLDPTNTTTNNVGVISAAVNAITATVPAGGNPIAIAGNGSNNKIYVINQSDPAFNGGGSVTVISTIDNFVVTTIQVGKSPVWGVMSPDGVHVFVVNQGSNDVSVIDTLLDQVIATIPVGTSPNYAVFEPKNQRVYVSNTGVSNTGDSFISVIKANGIDLANQILPTLIANIKIPAPANSVAALPDGTRAYATLSGCPTGTNHTTIINDIATSCNGNQVAVIDVQALKQTKLLTVGPGAVSIDAASNSSRVYVVSANDITTIADDVTPPPNPPQTRTFTTPSVSIINTSTDTVLRQTVDSHIVSLVPTFHVPQQDPACVPTIDPTFNHTVPIPCPLQTPFVVRVFP